METIVQFDNHIDFSQFIDRATALRDQLTTTQVELSEAEVTGQAAGGLIEVRVRGTGEVTDIKIDPRGFAAGDLGELEQLLMTAFRNAQDAARVFMQERADRLNELAGGLDDVTRLAP